MFIVYENAIYYISVASTHFELSLDLFGLTLGELINFLVIVLRKIGNKDY